MEVMWSAPGPLTVRAVLDQVNHRRHPPLAYTTVMTVMARLADKEVLDRTPAGRGYAYHPAVSGPAALAVRGVFRDFGETAVAHFVEQARGDPQLLERLERVLREEP